MRKRGLGLIILIITQAISMTGCGSPTPTHTEPKKPDTPIAPPLVCETPSVMLTSTDTPIAPPPPTATVIPPPPPRAKLIVVSSLNVREGPGIDYPIVGVASAGDTFQIVGINSSGDWLKVVTSDGSLGWISGRPAYTRVLGSLDGMPVVQSPLPSPTATPIAPPPATPIAPTPVLPGYQYHLGRPVTCSPNCGTTGIKGAVYDVSANRVPDVIVKVWTDGWCCAEQKTNTYAPYEILLSSGAKGGHWYVAVYSHDGSTQLSEVVGVYTDSEPCEPLSSGCQWAVVDFVASWTGTPIAPPPPPETPPPR